MRIFDTNVQEIKYKTLKEVIRSAYEGNLQSAALDIPKKLAPGPKPELRCCIYKERAILGERVKLAMGGDRDNPNVVEVIREAWRRVPRKRHSRHRRLQRLFVPPLRGRVSQGRDYHRQSSRGHRQGKVHRVRKVHSGVSLQRAHTSASPVYAQLQGQRHFHGCRQKGGD